MKIALVAPLYESVPPGAYGGTERVVAALADELVVRGHEVTLFAAAGSQTRAKLVPEVAAPLRLVMSRVELEQEAPHLHLKMLSDVFARSCEFDIIHSHTDIWTLPFLEQSTIPTVITMHGRLDLDIVDRVLPMYPHASLVSISESQREPVAGHEIRWVGTCYNGLDLDEYLSVPRGSGDYLAFVGRITREKRPDWAVEVARRAGMPLRVAAKVDPLDVDYWHDEIEPLFTANDVEFVGEITEKQKPEFFAGAAATLFPIDWPEPFGLVMIESLAAGTPVVALRRGSVPEVLTDGVSGFICDSLDEMVSAVGRLPLLTPENCRTEAERFSASAMADQYLTVYERLIAEGGRQRSANVIALPPVRDQDELDDRHRTHHGLNVTA